MLREWGYAGISCLKRTSATLHRMFSDVMIVAIGYDSVSREVLHGSGVDFAGDITEGLNFIPYWRKTTAKLNLQEQ